MPTTYAIPDGRTAFNVLTWSGAGGSSGATRSITGLNFKPDLVWEKSRTSGSGHQLMDSVRGAGTGKVLASNSTGAEPTPAVSTEALYGWLSSFDTGGFTTTNGTSTWDNFNKSGDTYVSWNWLAGGTPVTNNSGTISSSVSANPTAGFSVVTYTGTAASATVGHGLGVAPSMIIVKDRGSVSNWNVYHTSLGNTQAVLLNSTNATNTSSGYWNNTSPTSTVFSVGTGTSFTSALAYCFAAVAGYSAFGSYTGNGSADGPFIYTGFRPRWLMIKNAGNGVQGWAISDTSRSSYNQSDAEIDAQANSVERSNPSYSKLDFLSNGFKIRETDSLVNQNTNTMIYAAFAENPFKYANAR